MATTDSYLQYAALMTDAALQIGLSAAQIQATEDLNYDNRNWQAREAQKSRDWQTLANTTAYMRQREMYNDFYSKRAQVQQYKEAGLNPYLAATDGVATSTPTVSTSSSPTSAPSPNTNVPEYSTMFSFLDSLLKLKQTSANVAKTEAETKQIDKETSWIDRYNTASIAEMESSVKQVESNIKVNEQSVNESIQRVQESARRMDVMDSTIEVNGALVELHGSQKVVNDTMSVLNTLSAASVAKMLPYIEARQKAEIELTNAKTQESKNAATDNMMNASLKMIKFMVDMKMLDSSYYDNVIQSSKWDVRLRKREYHWKPVNDICRNVSMLCIGAGSVMSGGGALGFGTGAAAPTLTAPFTTSIAY